MTVSLEPGDVFNPFRMFTGIFVPTGIAENSELRQGDKLAYGALLRFAGRDGCCFPSMKKLGAKLGVSSRQARAYVAALEHSKLVRRVKRCDESGQTSNGFEFLWHALLTDSMKDTSGGPRNDTSALPRNGSSAEESQLEEGHLEGTEIRHRLPAPILKNPEGTSKLPAVCKRYPKLREALADYMQGSGEERIYPGDRAVVDVMDAAEGASEQDVIQCLRYYREERGLRPGTKNGPRHFTWFPTAVGDYFRQRRKRQEAAAPMAGFESAQCPSREPQHLDLYTLGG